MSTTRRGFIGALLATPLLARLWPTKEIVLEGVQSPPLAVPGAPEVETFKGARGMSIWSYTADGRMSVPIAGSDGVANLFGGEKRLCMALPRPAKGSDGDCLTLVGANADVTIATEAGADTLSFGPSRAATKLIAMNGEWVLWG